MKLYYSPLACDLADHIALHEAGMAFEAERVDLRTFRTACGENFARINPKKYVPALILDDDTMITENLAVLDWIAGETPALRIDGPMGRTRVLEALTYITTEIHKAYTPTDPRESEAKATSLAGAPEKIESLHGLVSKGVLSQQEFDDKKKQLLGKI